MAKKVMYTQPLLGERNAAGDLILVPGAVVQILQDGDPVQVYSDQDGTEIDTPAVPSGVASGSAGVSTRGELTVWLTPGSGYSGVATVGQQATTFPIPDISPDISDVPALGAYVGPAAAVAGDSSSAVVGSLKVEGDASDRLRFLADGTLRWVNQTNGATLVELIRTASGQIEIKGSAGGLRLRNDASPVAAPELHFYSANGGGTGTKDKLAWGIGIDVSADTPARDFAIFKAVGESVDDAVYGNHRGTLPSTWAFGQAPADDGFKLSVVAAGVADTAMGGLKVQIGGTTTGKALALRDGALVDRFYVDNTFTLKGSHALAGSSICIEADAANHRPLVFRDSDGTNYMGWYYVAGNLRLRSISAGLDFMQVSASANHLYVYVPFQSGNNSIIAAGPGQTVGFYGATGAARPSGTPAPATDLASVVALANSLRSTILGVGLAA